MFSALKVKGMSLYRLARKGIEIDRKEREVTIFDLQITSMDLPEVHFKISCSKGTYIRALARDIGRKMGCGGHLLRLRRVRSGSFTLERSISWETLKQATGLADLRPWLMTLKEALSRLPEMVVDERLVRKARVGQDMMVRDLSSHRLPAFDKGQWVALTSHEDGLVAVVKSEVGGTDLKGMSPEVVVLRAFRVFHPQHRFQTADHG